VLLLLLTAHCVLAVVLCIQKTVALLQFAQLLALAVPVSVAIQAIIRDAIRVRSVYKLVVL
jgi:hypothetical protein